MQRKYYWLYIGNYRLEIYHKNLEILAVKSKILSHYKMRKKRISP